jgi:lipopolysaccharide biosynthesis glycosyltransferase
MNQQERVKIFIGSGEASVLERKTLIYSLHCHSQRDLDIYVFNGTHDAIEHNDQPPVRALMPLKLKYQNATEFSLYRFLIPQICNYQGKAIWLDSDMVCLADIGELFDTPLNGCDFLAKANAYPLTTRKKAWGPKGKDLWGTSVMLIDCEKCRFDLEAIADEVDQGDYTLFDLLFMTPKFLQCHPYQIGQLDPQWNQFDYYDKNTKLIHYTNLDTQPWKHPNHPYGNLWFRYFREALAAGYVHPQNVNITKRRAYVRQSIMQGNSPLPGSRLVSKAMSLVKKTLKQPALQHQ